MVTMATMNLDIWEVFQLLQIVNGQTGDFAKVAKLQRLAESLELSDEEKVEVGWTETQIPDGRTVTKWDDTEIMFDVELSRKDFDLLLKIARGHTTWPNSPRVPILEKKLDNAKNSKGDKDED